MCVSEWVQYECGDVWCSMCLVYYIKVAAVSVQFDTMVLST